MTGAAEKQFISAEGLLEDSYRLAMQVLDSGFRPTFIVGVWRGGTPVGIAVQELLDYCGIETDHIAIRTSLYSRTNERGAHIRVHGMQYLIDTVSADDDLLIVDDVYDSGLSIDAVISELCERARRNTPRAIRVATPYYKPANIKVDRVPDYFVHETDRWLVFPHELHGLTTEELQNKPGVRPFVDRLIEAAQQRAGRSTASR